MADEKKELTQERIETFKENYTSIVEDSLEIAEAIDAKNPDLNLHGKLEKAMDGDNDFMDVCELMSDYNVADNKFTNEDLYNYIIEANKTEEE